MIKTKKDLFEYLMYEKKIYFNSQNGSALSCFLKCSKHYQIWRYIRTLRISEYHKNNSHKLRYAIYHRRKHKYGNKLCIEIPENCVGKGLTIYHISPIIINEKASIGRDFKISGSFCVGHTKEDLGAPVLGDNISAGWNSSVIGDIRIASNITIGAGAVVVTDMPLEGVHVAGVPAKVISHD